MVWYASTAMPVKIYPSVAQSIHAPAKKRSYTNHYDSSIEAILKNKHSKPRQQEIVDRGRSFCGGSRNERVSFKNGKRNVWVMSPCTVCSLDHGMRLWT